MADHRDSFNKEHSYGSAWRHFAITPDTPFTDTADAIYIGADGDVEIVGVDGNTIMYKNAKAGSILPVRCIEVTANSTGSDYVGLICN